MDCPSLDCAIKLSIWECYLSEVQLVPGGINEAVVLAECGKLALIEQRHNEILFLRWRLRAEGVEDGLGDRLEKLTNSNNVAWEEVITYDRLQLLPRKIEDDIFFEKLISYTSKAAFKCQEMEKKAENLERNSLLDDLLLLKRNYTANAELIRETELKLSNIEQCCGSETKVSDPSSGSRSSWE